MSSNAIEATTWLCKRAEKASFAQVVGAMDFSKVCSSVADDVNAFIQAHNLAEVPHIFMATHSFGERKWELEANRKPIFFEEEDLNGGWFIFCEADVNYLFCCSASSGSMISAEKQEDNTWSMLLEVPFQDGKPYKGAYWKAFHQALSLPTDAVCYAEA